MAEVFDLDAVMAEATDRDPFIFTFGGEQYQLPGSPDIIALASIDRGDIHAAMEALLGADAWAKMIASDAVLTIEAFWALMAAWMTHIGMDPGALGESVASSGSSKSTGRPSKRTSNGGTKPRSRTSAHRA